MVDYWGASANYYSNGPEGFGSWYTQPDRDAEVTFTPAVSLDKNGNPVDSGTSIDAFHQQLQNSQPAHLQALADQWQNMYYLLYAIRTQIFDESTTLAEEKWKSGAARDAFLKAGPGAALAYLDPWMDAALANQSALSAIVNIVLEYQAKIEPLWAEYKQAVQDAQNVSGWHQFDAWWVSYDVFGGSDQHDLDANLATDRANATKDVQTKYNIKAQAMAWSMAQEMFDSYSLFSGGHGPVYEAPDAVVDSPNGPRFPGGIPGGVGGTPQLPGVPVPPPMPALPTPPPGLTPPLGTPTPPTLPTVPAAPAAPTVPVAGTGLSVPGIGVGLAGLGLAGVGLPPAEPTAVPGGLTNPFQAPKLPGSSGLISRSAGDLEADARLSASSLPASALSKGLRNLTRRPQGEPETPAGSRRSGRRNADNAVAARDPGQEDLFGGNGARVTPPVLNNRRRGRSTTSTPPGVLSDELSTDLPGRSDAVRSVLGRLSRTGGAEAGEVDTTMPALRAPGPATGGGTVSGLEEVPRGLRAAPVQRGQSTIGRAPQTTPDNHRSDARRMTSQRPGELPDSAVIADEQAFIVETPGGSVLAARTDDAGPVPDAKAQVRGN